MSRSHNKKCPVCNSNQVVKLDYIHSIHMYECRQCDLIWQLKPDWQMINDTYEKTYFPNLNTSWWWQWALRVVTRLRVKKISQLVNDKQAQILEIGCGKGDLLVALKQAGFPHLQGIDMAEEAFAGAVDQGISIKHGNVDSDSLSSNTYDVIILHQVIEHVADPQKVIKKLYTSLKKGGYIYMSTPNGSSWQPAIFKQYWYGWQVPFHTFIFSPKNMAKICLNQGFSPVKTNNYLVPNDLTGSIENFLKAKIVRYDRYRSFTKPLLMILSLPIAMVELVIGNSSRFELVAQKSKVI